MSAPTSKALPLVLIAEDGDEYSARFSRLLGASFRFLRAGSFSEVQEALAGPAGPVTVLVLDLDFRRTPPALLVDERGAPVPAAEAARVAAVEGILLLRALRARGVRVPALLCADLDDPEQEARLCLELAPLEISPSTEGMPDVARRLRGLCS
jgi:hypothetical protein